MKIIHIVLSTGADYTDNYGYQENTLPVRHVELGNEVSLISSTTSSLSDDPKEHEECQYYTHSVKIIRLEPTFCFLNNRFECFGSLYKIIENEKPDLIFSHGFTYLSLPQLYKYKRKHPNVVIFFDCHQTYENSFNRFPMVQKGISYLFWRPFFNRYKKMFSKGYYIAEQVKRFMCEIYDMKGIELSHLPLGSKVPQDLIDNKKEIKAKWRLRNNITSKYVLVTGGRFRESKKLYELLKVINEIDNNDFTLCVFGRFESEEYMEKCKTFLDNRNVRFIGWLNTDETIETFAASDLGLFSGGQSVIWRTAIATGLPLICEYSEGAEELDQGGNCILINGDDEDAWIKSISILLSDENRLKQMELIAQTKGREFFSEEKIAQSIINDYYSIQSRMN